jgi:hypothetical protein
MMSPTLEPRCRHCGDVIGVYEPVIVLVDGDPLSASRAVVHGTLRGAPCFHETCFSRARAQPAGAQASEDP